MANQIQRLSYEYGVIDSVSTQSMTATLRTSTGRLTASIPRGGAFTIIPSEGETWTFYRNGITCVLNARYTSIASGDETHLFQGDAIASIPGTLHVSAGSIDATDQFGELFNPLSGMLSTSRLPSTRVYAVRSESDAESLDGLEVTPPCVLLVFPDEGDPSMVWRKE